MLTPTNSSVEQPIAPRKSNMTVATDALNMDLLYPNEVAEILRLSRMTIYRMASKGLLPVCRVCRKMLFKRQDVLDFIERSKDNPYGS